VYTELTNPDYRRDPAIKRKNLPEQWKVFNQVFIRTLI